MKTDFKGFTPIFLLLIVVIVIVGGYYLVQKNIIQVNPTPTPTATPNTNNWKTYINSKNKYSLKYPTDISVDTNGNFKIGNDYSFGIITSNTSGTNLFVLKPANLLQIISLECPSLNGQKSCSDPVSGPITGSLEFDQLGRHYAGEIIVLENNGVFYEAQLGALNPNVEISSAAKKTFNQVLSTLSFTK